MNKFIFFLFLLFSVAEASANIKQKILQNLDSTNNLTFNFEQNIDGEKEKGKCVLMYPKKIFCQYHDIYNKILVSNGKSLIISPS